MGTGIAILLGFRTSAAYERWWEARKIWGSIVNDSRTLVRQAIGFIVNDQEKNNEVVFLAKYQIAFCYSLSASLRKIALPDVIESNLSERDFKYIGTQANKPNAILKLIEDRIAILFRKGKIDSYHFAAMDQTLKALCDHMGKSERIKNTVFPVHYGFYIRLSIIIFAFLLPLEIVEFLGVLTIPITFATILFISVIESIANYLQDPFENRAADIGMSTICRTIEINLLQMTGFKEVPEMLKPDKNGIVM
jgi:putative membrane protein